MTEELSSPKGAMRSPPVDTTRKEIKAAEHNGAPDRTEEIKTPEPLEEGPAEEAGRAERSDSRGSPQGGRRYVQVMGSGLLAEMKAKQERRAACAQKVRKGFVRLLRWGKRYRKIACWLDGNINSGCPRDGSVVMGTCYSYRGPWFRFLACTWWFRTISNVSSRGPDAVFLRAPDTQALHTHAYTYTCKENTHKINLTKKVFRNVTPKDLFPKNSESRFRTPGSSSLPQARLCLIC
jgi:hypothetical protein